MLEKQVGARTITFFFILCTVSLLFLIVYTYKSELKEPQDVKNGVKTQAMIAEKEVKDTASSDLNVLPSANGSVMVVPSPGVEKEYVFHLYADKKVYELEVEKKVFDQYNEKDKISVILYDENKIKIDNQNQ